MSTILKIPTMSKMSTVSTMSTIFWDPNTFLRSQSIFWDPKAFLETPNHFWDPKTTLGLETFGFWNPWDCTASASLKTNFWPYFLHVQASTCWPRRSSPPNSLILLSTPTSRQSIYVTQFWSRCWWAIKGWVGQSLKIQPYCTAQKFKRIL